MSDNNITFVDKEKVAIRGNVQLGLNIKIDINVILEGSVTLGNNVVISANCIIKDSKINHNTKILAFTSIQDSEIGTDCKIGPYANIRNRSEIKNNISIGNYVEIKKSIIDKNSSVNHLSFIGDAEIEENVTIGAGTITCNHDGKKHNRTIIKKGSYIGSGCKLIAPITIGSNSVIGSGSVITHNTPENKLSISRSKQRVLKKWKKK